MKIKFITKPEYHKRIRANKRFSVIIWRKSYGEKEFKKYKYRTHYKNGLTKYKMLRSWAVRMEVSCYAKYDHSIEHTIAGVKYWDANEAGDKFKIQLVKR